MDHTRRVRLRVALPVPETAWNSEDGMDWHKAIAVHLERRSIPYRREGAAYVIQDVTGRERRFSPGEWMLINRYGLHKVTPLRIDDYAKAAADGPVRLAGVAYGVATGEADIWDASCGLASPPQRHGDVWRLVPDLDTIQPRTQTMGIIYVPIPPGAADPGDVALWRIVPDAVGVDAAVAG